MSFIEKCKLIFEFKTLTFTEATSLNRLHNKNMCDYAIRVFLISYGINKCECILRDIKRERKTWDVSMV